MATGARIVTTNLARRMEKVSMSQAAWLKKRWNRDQCPSPTRPLEEDDFGHVAVALEMIQPVTITTNVW